MIIEEGQRNYNVTKFHNEHILFEIVSNDALSLYNFGEEDHKYNNIQIKNYLYTTVTNIDFCNIKTYTGVDLVIKNNSQIYKKLTFPCHRNDSKLKSNHFLILKTAITKNITIFCGIQENIIEVNNSILIIRNQLYLRINFKL